MNAAWKTSATVTINPEPETRNPTTGNVTDFDRVDGTDNGYHPFLHSKS